MKKIVLNKNLFLIITIVVGVFVISTVGFASWKCFEEISKLENEKFQPINFSTKEKTEINSSEKMKAELFSETSATEDWKSYKNTKYGYEIKYPADWEMPLISEHPFNLYIAPKKSNKGYTGNIQDVYVHNFVSAGSIEKNVNHLKNIRNPKFFLNDVKEINIIDGKGYYSIVRNVGGDEELYAYLVGENNLISITYYYISDMEKAELFFNQILSTFKFIENDIALKPNVFEIWEPICGENNLEKFSTIVKKGEGYTHIARRMLEKYFNTLALKNFPTGQSHIFFTAEEKIYAEDYIRKRFDINNFYTGATIKISCNIIEDAALKARLLTIKQKENLKSYSKNVENFHILELINQVIEGSIDKTDDLNIQIFSF